MNDGERDALLVRVDERLIGLTDTVGKHLSHHWAVTLMASFALLSAVIALVVGLVR